MVCRARYSQSRFGRSKTARRPTNCLRSTQGLLRLCGEIQSGKLELEILEIYVTRAKRKNFGIFFQVLRVNNFFLAQLGLLKMEDKKFEPAYNPAESLRYVFDHAISQPGTVPKDVAVMYMLFLNQFPLPENK